MFGPKLIVGRINQDEMISPQVTLWNQQGSRVIWGTLLVIPINESLLYVRPLYLQSSEAKIPELKQVIVAYQGRIEMAETLTRALGQNLRTEHHQPLWRRIGCPAAPRPSWRRRRPRTRPDREAARRPVPPVPLNADTVASLVAEVKHRTATRPTRRCAPAISRPTARK